MQKKSILEGKNKGIKQERPFEITVKGTDKAGDTQNFCYCQQIP